jgi:hypothetical protein
MNFTIEGFRTQITVGVLRYQFSDPKNYYDANWLVCEGRATGRGYDFVVRRGCFLFAAGLAHLGKEFAALASGSISQIDP